MPLYEYECDTCRHRFEAIQKFSDPPVETCPKCGGTVRKLVAAPAFQFKGSGWYITDYAKKDAGKGDGSSKDTSASGEAGKTDKSEKSSEKSGAADSAAPAATTPGASGSKEKPGG